MLKLENRNPLTSNIVSCRPIRLKIDACTSLESHLLERQGHCALPQVQNPGSPHLAATIPHETNKLGRICVIGKMYRSAAQLHHTAARTGNGRVELRVGRKKDLADCLYQGDDATEKKRVHVPTWCTSPVGIRRVDWCYRAVLGRKRGSGMLRAPGPPLALVSQTWDKNDGILGSAQVAQYGSMTEMG